MSISKRTDEEDGTTHTTGYRSASKKNESLPRAAARTDTEGAVLAALRQGKTSTVRQLSQAGSEEYAKPVSTAQKQHAPRYREEASGHQWQEGRGEGRYRGGRKRGKP